MVRWCAHDAAMALAPAQACLMTPSSAHSPILWSPLTRGCATHAGSLSTSIDARGVAKPTGAPPHKPPPCLVPTTHTFARPGQTLTFITIGKQTRALSAAMNTIGALATTAGTWCAAADDLLFQYRFLPHRPLHNPSSGSCWQLQVQPAIHGRNL